MAKKDKKGGLTWWIVFFILIGLGLVWFLLTNLPEKDKSLVGVIGILGAYVSTFSLVLMFSQFKSIRDISQETKDKMDTMVSVSNLAKHAELARSAQSDVKEGKDDLAIYKIQIIKETLIKLEKNEYSVKVTASDFCGRLGMHLTSLRSDSSNIRRNVINNDLENIADFLLRQEETIKEKSN